MKAEEFNTLDQLFCEAIRYPPGPERQRVLNEQCPEPLRHALHRLLAADAAMPTMTITAPSLPELGGYQAEERIGVGGSGIVYRARRTDGEYEQQVAVKVLRTSALTPDDQRRFRRERQTLAQLEHPHIARLLDGGVTASSEPYLVMELVKGEPIGQYCDSLRMTVTERLQLFAQVLDAVAYSHRCFIVHGDLKPSNILAGTQAGVKLLDFGSSRFAGDENDNNPTVPRALTPRYASPEQLRGEPAKAASDVFALGMVLYELLTGAAPFGTDSSIAATLNRALKPADPQTAENAITDAAAQERGTTFFALRNELHGDLSSILRKTLAFDAAARYSTVAEFSADLERYATGRPVLAHADSFGYRASKFVRRYRLAVSGAALLLVTVLAGIGGVVRQSRIANIERHKAEARSEDLRKLSNSLLSEIGEAIQKLPGSTAAQKLLVSTVVDHLDRMEKDGSSDPALQLDLANAYVRLGNVQGNPYDQNIGDSKGALTSLDKAISVATALRRQQPGDDAALRALGLAQQSRSEVLFGIGRMQESVAAVREAIQSFEALASRPGASANALNDAGSIYGALGDQLGQRGTSSLNDLSGASAAYRKDLEFVERALQVNPHNLRSLRAAAVAHLKIGNVMAETDPGSALSEYQMAFARMNALPEEAKAAVPNRRFLAQTFLKIGRTLWETGQLEQARSYIEQSMAIVQPFVDADPADARSAHDLVTNLDSEAECYEVQTGGAFPEEKMDRVANATHALKTLSEMAGMLNRLLVFKPDSLNYRTLLGLILIRISLQQQVLDQRQGTLELAAKGVALLKDVRRHKDAAGFELDLAANGLLIVLPPQLQDPGLAVTYAERMVDLSAHRKPGYLLTLATAYHAAGQPTKGRAAALEGLALLPAAGPTVIPSRLALQLREQAAK